ncbi:hypothetical protein TREES_T100009070 [Tupaia chinensis]|uniref:Uncharacterized protein n=1 Tax=Tupaia chinensis TaxID=246437 RepID=L9KNW5_TUPCH|nr:hypothetical protein TREES_T100009070 [Tupaia chinensis]
MEIAKPAQIRVSKAIHHLNKSQAAGIDCDPEDRLKEEPRLQNGSDLGVSKSEAVLNGTHTGNRNHYVPGEKDTHEHIKNDLKSPLVAFVSLISENSKWKPDGEDKIFNQALDKSRKLAIAHAKEPDGTEEALHLIEVEEKKQKRASTWYLSTSEVKEKGKAFSA